MASLSFLLCWLIAVLSCGGGSSVPAQSGSLSGNWEIQLFRHVLPNPPLVYSGFLVQSGSNINGSLMFNLSSVGSGQCEGVGTVSGTLNQQNVTLTINELGETISLIGSLPSNSGGSSATAVMNGEFSNVAGGCTYYTNTGTWTATYITPISGSFHGTLTSTATPPNGTVTVTGTLNQGNNTGANTANLSGNIAATSPPTFCSYLSNATISGLISGTSVVLSLYGTDGSLISQLGQLGNDATITITPDAKSMTGTYSFPFQSSSCPGDQGTFQLNFP